MNKPINPIAYLSTAPINTFKQVPIAVMICLVILSFFLSTNSLAGDYLQHPSFLKLLDDMEKVQTKDNTLPYKRLELINTFSEVKQQKSILEAIARPAEKTKTWAEYRPIFINDKQIKSGIAFWKAHKETFDQAVTAYQVPAEIILAIIGVETRYGQYKGKHSVLSSLATLAFDYPPRSKFFYQELIEFLTLTKEIGLDPKTVKGSYAGAMGFPQFISSSYRNYAIDFDKDGKADLINNPKDAIGSVANYFVKHGWKPGKPTVIRARKAPQDNPKDLEGWVNASLKPKVLLSEAAKYGIITDLSLPTGLLVAPFEYQGKSGKEYWFGLDNFYVITRYNRSRLYAMAVYQLSEALAAEIKHHSS